MRKIVSLILLLNISLSIKSQSFFKEYSYNVINSYQTDASRAICKLPSGNIIIAGENVRGSNYWNGYGYGYFIKLDPQGNIIQSEEISESLAVGATTLNLIESNKIIMTSAMGVYSSITAIDTNLNVLLHERYYGGGEFYYNRLTQTDKTTDNNYVSVGTSGGLSNAQASLWILKTSLTGSVIWGKGFGLGGDEDGADIIEVNGSYYAYGYGTGYLGYTVPWLVKVDANGNLKWAKIIKAPIGGGNCRTILKTLNNNLLLTYEASHNSTSLNRAKSDICITVIDTNGVNVWSKRYLSPTFNKSSQTILDIDGNIYYSGFLDQDTSYRFVGGIDEAMPYITKLDPAGNVQWSKGVLDTTIYLSPLLESPLANNFVINNEGVFFTFTAANKDSLTDGGSRNRYKTVLSKISTSGEGCVYNNPTTSISFTPSIIDVTSLTDVLSGSTKKVSSITTASIVINEINICNNEVGIYETEGNNQMIFYPNPTQGKVIFEATEKIKSIEVYSVSGKKIKSFSNTNQVDISELPLGVYITRIKCGNKVMSKLLVKE